jgi:predicted RNA-binding protein YlxR (DUF448 family)
VSGEVKQDDDLLRLAVSPTDELVPDVAAKLPGRGIWVSANRTAIDLAAKKGLFNRAAGRAVNVPEGLSDRFEALLEARALSLLGLARRAGDLALGYDAARLALKAGKPAWRIEASDGAADGRGKLDRLTKAAWGDVPTALCFDAEQLGVALGRGPVVHAVLAEGAQSRSFGTTLGKLSGFRPLDP